MSTNNNNTTAAKNITKNTKEGTATVDKKATNKKAPSTTIKMPMTSILLKDAALLETVVHDLHIMDQVFVVGFYDKDGKLLMKHNDHPFTLKSVKNRDTDFAASRAKCVQTATSWRILVLRPTPKAIRYMEELNFALNFIEGKLDEIITAAL